MTTKLSLAISLLLIFTYLGLAITYSMVTPLYEAPDEIGHVAYLLQLRERHTLPVQQVGVLGSAQHPPLYYAIATLLAWPADLTDGTGVFQPNPAFMWGPNGGHEVNAGLHYSAATFPYHGIALFVHLARLASILMGAGTVFLVLCMGWHLFPATPAIGLLAAALVAFNPQFLFISSVVNNDNLLILATTAIAFTLLCALAEPHATRHWLWVGLWLSVATLAKVNGLLMLGVVGLCIGCCALRARSWTLLVRTGLAVGLPLLLLTSWWFFRNWTLYGDPLGWTTFKEVYHSHLRTAPLTGNDLRQFFTTQLNSFWGLFGWMNLWAPAWFYTWIRLLGGAAVVGLFVFLWRGWTKITPVQRTMVVALALTVVAYEGYILWAINTFNAAWYQGRYLLPVVGPLMLLTSLGLLSLAPARFRPALASSFTALLLAIAIFMPLRVLAPAYRTVPQPKAALWFLPHPRHDRFGDAMLLRGYRIKTVGDQVILDLYWQALTTPDFNYSAFVHLLDPQEQIIAQQDHAPGEAEGYPPTVWQPGDIVIGEYTLTLPAGQGLDHYRLRVGLYNWETGARLPVQTTAGAVQDFVILE